LATRAIAAIKKELKTNLAIKTLFENPTVATLSTLIQNQDSAPQIPEITRQVRPERIPLSYAQERIWLIDKIEGSQHYHIPAVLKLKGTLDIEALKYAFRQILQRHEVLRTVLKESDGALYQEIKTLGSWELEVNPFENPLATDEDFLFEKIHQSFDLSKDIMLRASLETLADDEQLLIIVMHHAASDGWSIGNLINELVAFYTAQKTATIEQLESLNVQYADYAIWQKKYLTGGVLEQKLNYWKNKLQEITALNLPNDEGNVEPIEEEGGSFEFLIPKAHTKTINQLAQKEEATLFMVLLAGFKALLYHYSKQEDICIGAPIANRTQKEVEPLIGFFLNTLALRTEFDSTQDFKSLLALVKATTLEAYEHQDLPFEKVLEVTNPDRSAGANALFNVFFNLQNQPLEKMDVEGLSITQIPNKTAASKFDITFYISESKEGLKGLFVYNSKKFTKHRMEQMSQDFTQLLEAVLENPESPIQEINYLSESEQEAQQQELMDFFGDF
jgi:NRPS condensation-like uncharacterized protein